MPLTLIKEQETQKLIRKRQGSKTSGRTSESFDASGKQLDFIARDLVARVAQHEQDHLVGKVFFDRMRSFEWLTYLEEFARYWQQEKKE